ncbi:MAG: hypothetical protein KatS3mg011_1508 [Acidimicrobiia bacterium]|nr:MAG: hypothetical protein KatS3mg011_1508 [Acidimicrobiia bacterium]
MTVQEIFRVLGLKQVNSGVYAAGWVEAEGDELVVENPATGEPLGTVVTASRADYERVVETSVETFRRWRMLPAPKRGEYVRRLGNALTGLEGTPGRPGDPGEREDPRGRGRRGPGDDRHLRLRGGTLPATLRVHHGFGASPPPHVRAVASPGTGRGDHRVQLSGGGLVLELGHRRGVRRHPGVEAVRADSPHRGGGHRDMPAGDGGKRLRRGVQPGGGHRPRRRRLHGRRPAVAADLGDWFGPHGKGGRTSGGCPARPYHPRAGWQQRDHRHGRRRPRSGGAGGSVRRGGHRRAALHHPPSPHRPRSGGRSARSIGSSTPTPRCG